MQDLMSLIPAISALVAIATFFIGRQSAARDMGKEAGEKDGTLLTEVGWIKGGIDDIKRQQDKLNEQVLTICTRLTAVETSTKQAHKRIDRLEGQK